MEKTTTACIMCKLFKIAGALTSDPVWYKEDLC